ncbi:MAG: hypothetical protein KIT84_04830 [Labilithrix sp.]|nr:hypothetical protein [Labilithrix sp.]MCW5810311.1 hypothetical protein [Labilithrix sp.]
MTPSTSGAPVVAAVAAVSTLVILSACSHASNVVEAPMVSVDASAAAIALVTESREGPRAGSQDLLIHIGDRLVGTYRCAQGATELTIVLGEIGRGDGEVSVIASAVFHFAGAPGRDEEEGSFRVRGTFDPRSKRLHLRGDEWIDQPPGYQLVSFLGRVEKKNDVYTYAGTVEGHQCTTFHTVLERDDDGEEEP